MNIYTILQQRKALNNAAMMFDTRRMNLSLSNVLSGPSFNSVTLMELKIIQQSLARISSNLNSSQGPTSGLESLL